MVRIAMLACLLVAATSCRTKYQPQTVEVVDPGPPQRVLPTVRVLDAGMTPRVPLRYRVEPGQSEVLYLELARAQAMQAGDRSGQSGIPPVQLEVKMGPAQPTPQGFIRHPVQITQVRISDMANKMSPAQREQMETTLAPLLQVRVGARWISKAGFAEVSFVGWRMCRRHFARCWATFARRCSPCRSLMSLSV